MAPYQVAYHPFSSVIGYEHRNTIDPYEVMSVVLLPSRADESGCEWKSVVDWPYGLFSVVAIEDGENSASSLTFQIEVY